MNKSLETVRKLGFGLMRLPQKDGAVDVEQVKEMVDLFMEAGFTYFDTAWAYAGSEDAIRQALVDDIREKEGKSVDELFRDMFRTVPFGGGEW